MALPGEQQGSKESGQQTNSDNTTANSTGANTSNKATLDQDDKDFNPTAEALIDEIDDERTLEEEEALDGQSAAAVQNELDDLKRESEMPIQELLAYYERMRNEAAGAGQEDEDEDEFDEDLGDEDDDEEDDEGEEDVSEVRNRENKVTTNSSNCTDRLTQNAHEQQPQLQTHQRNDSSLPIPPQQRPTPQTDRLNETNTHSNAVSLGEQQLNVISTFAVPLTEHPGRDVESGLMENEHNTVSSTSRHKHSMTEFMIDAGTGPNDMFKTLLDYDLDDSDDLDEDYSYTDDEDERDDWRKVIHVGPEFQAEIPESLSEYENDLPPYEGEDKLVWKCDPELAEIQILSYLKQSSNLSKRNDISISPASVPKISEDTTRNYRERFLDNVSCSGLQPLEHNYENIHTDHHRDNTHDLYMTQSRKRSRIDYEIEQENAMDGINQTSGDDVQSNHLSNSAREDNSNSTSQDTRPEMSIEEYFQGEEQLLYLLLQCNYNFEEALRRRRLDPFKYYLYEPMSLWSQDECLGFEHGLRICGKDFCQIRNTKVPTRTRAEVVSFYYLWKKSERHDVYINQYRLDRKRCLSHPGTTDYMDKFIEDNESILNASSTPTPTPTESTVEISQITADGGAPLNRSLTLCRAPAGSRSSTLLCSNDIPDGAENTSPTGVSLPIE